MVRTRQWLQASLLLFTGLYFLDNMLSGRIYFYINERFGWLSWMSTILFLTLGIFRITDLLKTRVEHSHEAHEHDVHEQTEHDHAGHTHASAPSWLKLGIVSIPLLMGLIIPSKPLGAAAVKTSGLSTQFSSQGQQTSQFNVSPADRNVLDWVRAFNSSSGMNEFTGQPADLIGFVYRDIRFDGKPQFMIARFAISCCVADASALGVIVQTADSAKLTQDSWVHVKGKFAVQSIDQRDTPVLIAESVEQTTQPTHPYLYP